MNMEQLGLLKININDFQFLKYYLTVQPFFADCHKKLCNATIFFFMNKSKDCILTTTMVGNP